MEKTFKDYIIKSNKSDISSTYTEWKMIEYNVPLKYFNEKYNNIHV